MNPREGPLDSVCLHHVELAKAGMGLTGGETCLIELGKYTASRCQNIVYVPDNGRVVYQKHGFSGSNVRYRVIGSFAFEKRFGILLSYVARTVIGLLALPRLDPARSHVIVSHSHSWPTMIFSYMMRRRNPHAAWIVFIHLVHPRLWRGFGGEYTGRFRIPTPQVVHHWLNDRLAFRLAARATTVIVVNPAYLDLPAIKRIGVQREILTYGSDAIDVVDRLGPRQDVTTKKFDAVFVGRFHEQKGLSQLADIWARVAREVPNATLAIVGGDTTSAMGKTVADQLRAHGLEHNVTWLGFQEGLEKYRIVLSSRVFVFPSLYESFGIVAIEAMSCGLPVVAYDLPVYSVFGSSMSRVPILDNQAFAGAVVRLLTCQDVYDQKSREVREFAQGFSWEKSGRQFERIARDALDRSRA